jgi:hypothetical protein
LTTQLSPGWKPTWISYTWVSDGTRRLSHTSRIDASDGRPGGLHKRSTFGSRNLQHFSIVIGKENVTKELMHSSMIWSISSPNGN